MTKSKSHKKTKQIKNQLVVMSRIDSEIAKGVYLRLLFLGMDDEELSFLLGKRNKYVFDILDPTEKNKFKTEQLDYLPTILRTSIQELVPKKANLSEEIKIQASKTVYDHKIVYQFSEVKENGDEAKPVVWTKKLKIGVQKVHTAVHQAVLEIYENGGFDTPRSALDLFIEIEKDLSSPFSPRDLQKSLSVLMTAKGKFQFIKRLNKNARYYYVKRSQG
jgi:hypothetical protein